MNTYQRIFGTGPRGFAVSLVLLLITIWLESILKLPEIFDSRLPGIIIFSVSILITALMVIWSVKSLPPASRGNQLVTTGSFKYFRHPLYAAFLISFNFGLAALLNNWIYIAWALIQHPVWHFNIKGEERLMLNAFPHEYETYSRKTGRFFPRLYGETKR